MKGNPLIEEVSDSTFKHKEKGSERKERQT